MRIIIFSFAIHLHLYPRVPHVGSTNLPDRMKPKIRPTSGEVGPATNIYRSGSGQVMVRIHPQDSAICHGLRVSGTSPSSVRIGSSPITARIHHTIRILKPMSISMDIKNLVYPIRQNRVRIQDMTSI